MGSPMVFQTAPPQPASKARITWPPVFVGGPDASQKGLGDFSPQKFTLRSAIETSLDRKLVRYFWLLYVVQAAPDEPNAHAEHAQPTYHPHETGDLNIV